MRRTPTGLLPAVLLALFAARSLNAQVAPTISGETGLFRLVNAETLPAGRFSLGLSFSSAARTAGPSLLYPTLPDDPLRYRNNRFLGHIAYGLTPLWEVSLSSGQQTFDADDRNWAGVINGHEQHRQVDRSETDKVRIGSKYVFPSRGEPVRVAIFGGLSIPTQSRNTPQALTTYRTDYDFGVSMNYSIFTLQASYLLAGDLGTTFDVPNQFIWALGFNVPIIPKVLRGIAEINRVHYDGGDTKPADYTEVTLGGRVAIAKTGLTASGAVLVNIDRWTKHGSSPSNLGAILQLAYLPQPVSAPTPGQLPAPAAAEPEPTQPVTVSTPTSSSEPALTPAATNRVPPREIQPLPKTETSTTDEILFDPGKSRLTNIAKAILDGVALRLKNNLSATCTVTAHTDPKEKPADHAGLSKARAEAAKDYLMKRHGIDASRIKIEMKGDAEAGADATRNRRAVVTVTFP